MKAKDMKAGSVYSFDAETEAGLSACFRIRVETIEQIDVRLCKVTGLRYGPSEIRRGSKPMPTVFTWPADAPVKRVPRLT